MDVTTRPTTPTEAVHRLEVPAALRLLGSSAEGLTSAEAQDRLVRYGPNELREAARRPLILTFLAEFTSPMALLLWAAAATAIVAGIGELGAAIVIVNLVNGVFGFWQEYRAERATEALQRMLSSSATVVRDGDIQQIPAEGLVPGDLIIVAEGDRVGADARLVEANELEVDQSPLSGESRPVHKNANPLVEDRPTAQRTNLVFAGTTVGSGDGRAVVTATGMTTEFGRIAELTQSVQDKRSPLQEELARLTRQLSLIALGLGAVFIVVAILFVGEPWSRAFIFGLGMIVAFIPEGLLPTVTLTLAMAVQRMAKQNALMKKLSSVETLGCTTVICSDKTGTLTQNQMTVVRLWLPGHEFQVSGQGYEPGGEISLDGQRQDVDGNPDLRALLEAASLCNNSVLRPAPPGEDWLVHGDPTEVCLHVAAAKAGIDLERLHQECPRVRELPFESHRKRMTTIELVAGRPVAFVKGSPQGVLPLCGWLVRDGVRVSMTPEERDGAAAMTDTMARRGLRVLAVAVRDLDPGVDPAVITVTEAEHDLTFLGLVAMEDPPREGVVEAVASCHRASIRVIMITGDYGLTAESIARDIGIVHGRHPLVVSGEELGRLTDAELVEALRGEVVFARVAPEDKFRVVSALQGMGHTVAVTGDGVNDAPALKKADIGIAMGLSGTDVAREAADMVLTDDHFGSIVRAIEEGRAVYQNIRKFLTYILTSNMAEAAPSALFLLSRGVVPLPLTVMQILTIDLGTDLLPALGLSTERPHDQVMDQPPRNRNEPLMNRRVLWLAFGWYGLLEALFGLTAYFVVNLQHGWPGTPLAGDGEVYTLATTMTLAAIIFGQIGAVLNCRTERASLFSVGLFGNRRVMAGIVAELLLLAALSYVPWLQGVFGTAPLRASDWMLLAVLPVVMVALDEARKAVLRRAVPAA